MKRIFPILFTSVIIMNAGILSAIKSREVLSKNLNVSALKDGDLIVRNGKGLVSHWFRKMSVKDPQFSHAGLIAIENNKVFVYHSYQEGIPSGLIKESLIQFINPVLCDKYAVYRYDFNDASRTKVKYTMKVDLSSNLPFDDSFELKNGRPVYCSEWIHDCLNSSMGDSNFICTSTLKDFEYVSIENLYLTSHAKKILQQHY